MSIIRNAGGVPTTFRGFLWSKIIDAMAGSSVAQGDILYRGASGWARLGAGTSGQILKSNGASANPSWASASGVGVSLLIGSDIVAGSAATSMTVSGLDIDTDGAYQIIIALDNATGSTMSDFIYFNGDTTNTNYSNQNMTANSTTISGGRANTPNMGSLIANEGVLISGTAARDVDGRVRFVYQAHRDTIAAVVAFSGAVGWTSSSNLTSITVTAGTASGFSIGSKLRVYKLG